MSRKKKLTTRILIIIPLCMLLTFTAIFVAFHIIMREYIKDITVDSMNEEFLVRHVDESVKFGDDYMYDNRIYFPVHTFIVAPDKNPKKIIGDWYLPKEKEYAEQLLKELKKKGFGEDINKISLNLNEDSLIVEKRRYEGKFDGYFIDSKVDKSDADKYDVYVYINTNSVQQVVNKMDFLIILLFVIFGLCSTILILCGLRRVNFSFKILNDYLIHIGKRETVPEKVELKYLEFDQMANTIDMVSKLIDRSEKVQKDFFQNASHELRTPLTSIQGYTEAIMHNAVEPEAGLEVIYKQSRKMSGLVDQILYLTRFESMEISTDKVNLKEIVYASADGIFRATSDGMNFESDLPDSVEIEGDKELLEKVFDNIFSNANRYAKNLVTVNMREAQAFTIIDITDDGEGIANEDIDHIFERFYKGKGGGFGIGLSLASEIMKKHGGHIEVDSEPGRTTFSLFFPQS